MQKNKALKRLKVPLWALISCIMLSSYAYAQTPKITGKIADQKTAAAMAGATVMVKGTSRSTTTDGAGRFAIEAAPGDILVITFVGHVTQELKVEGPGELNVQLEEDYNRLEDVIVIGYGTQKKKLTTGANLQVKGDDIQKQSTTSALQALQGQAPGVQITTTSGQPGSGMNVIIRGKGTIGNFG